MVFYENHNNQNKRSVKLLAGFSPASTYVTSSLKIEVSEMDDVNCQRPLCSIKEVS